MSDLGNRIRKAREAKGLSQVELASLIGVKSGQVISNWEKGENKPNVDLLIALCKVLDVSLADLMNYHGNEINLSAAALSIAARYDRLTPLGQQFIEDAMSIEEQRESQ